MSGVWADSVWKTAWGKAEAEKRHQTVSHLAGITGTAGRIDGCMIDARLFGQARRGKVILGISGHQWLSIRSCMITLVVCMSIPFN